MSILKVIYLAALFFQIFYSLVIKIEICLKYFLDKNSQKQPLWKPRYLRWFHEILHGFLLCFHSSILLLWVCSKFGMLVHMICNMYVICSCSCVKPRMKAKVTVQWFWTLRCITVATFFDRELPLAVLYFCFCLLLVLLLLSILSLQAQIGNIFLSLIGIFSIS